LCILQRGNGAEKRKRNRYNFLTQVFEGTATEGARGGLSQWAGYRGLEGEGKNPRIRGHPKNTWKQALSDNVTPIRRRTSLFLRRKERGKKACHGVDRGKGGKGQKITWRNSNSYTKSRISSYRPQESGEAPENPAQTLRLKESYPGGWSLTEDHPSKRSNKGYERRKNFIETLFSKR